MRLPTMKGLRTAARWIQRLLEVRLPIEALYGFAGAKTRKRNTSNRTNSRRSHHVHHHDDPESRRGLEARL